MTHDQVTNQDFMRAMFPGAGPEAFGWVCSFSGDPKSASNRDWLGHSCRVASLPYLDEAGNTYFNISTLKAHDGRVARKGENFDALWVVVLDDVGTKATLPEGFVPTYSIETSKNNFQCGLKLSTPLRDMGRAKALFKALASMGFTDPGAQGPQSRYVRLPVGVNHKGEYGPGGFPHRLTLWNPDHAFTIDEIVSIFGLDLGESATATVAKKVAPDNDSPDVEDKADAIIIAKVLRSTKARRVWSCEGGDGFASGSDADQYLLNCIAFSTESAEQVERIYSQSPRASRKSSDGTCKWLQRADYRKRSIDSAFRFVEAHPKGDADDARVTVEAAVNAAKVMGDFRGLYAPEVVEAFAMLQTGDAANYDYFRKQARKAGATLATLDAEVSLASDAQNLSHADAAELAIAKLGGIDSLVFSRGQWWNWRQELGIWKGIDSDETIKKAIHDVLPDKQITAGVVGSVLSVLRTKAARDDVEFDRPSSEYVVNCLNGTLRLRDVGFYEGMSATEDRWELHPHRREDYLTARVPVAWLPSAQCPRFERFLVEITRDDDDAEHKRRVLMEAIGYSLMPSAREERFVILYGESTSNGKSTLLEVIKRLAGDENCSALTLQQLGERFSLANLQSKLVNLCPEIPRGAALPDDVIKKLTSGDTITVERKGRDHYELKPFATLWFATNSLPNLKDLTPAVLEKRCILIELNRSFRGEDRDARLIDKLTEELPGIFYQCVEWFGAMSVLSREPCTWSRTRGPGEGMEATGWYASLMTDPPSSVRAKSAWRKDADPVQQFADDRLVVGTEHYVEASELFRAWQAWAEENGVRLSLDSRRLSTRLGKMFPQIVTGDEARQDRRRGVRGLGFAKATA